MNDLILSELKKIRKSFALIVSQLSAGMNSELDPSSKKIQKIQGIQKLVADEFEMPIAIMISSRRFQNYVWPRQIAMYLASIHTGASLSDLAHGFGHKSHGSVSNSVKKVANRMATEERARSLVLKLEEKVRLLVNCE